MTQLRRRGELQPEVQLGHDWEPSNVPGEPIYWCRRCDVRKHAAEICNVKIGDDDYGCPKLSCSTATEFTFEQVLSIWQEAYDTGYESGADGGSFERTILAIAAEVLEKFLRRVA